MTQANTLFKTLVCKMADCFEESLIEYFKHRIDGDIQAIYPYFNKDGSFAYANVRFWDGVNKTFRAVSYDANRQIVMKKGEKPEGGYPLFEHELVQENPNALVIVCEGEKATYAINKRSLADGTLESVVAVTSGGAASANSADWNPLQGANVLVWPDNDEPGEKYALEVAQQLQGIASSVACVDTQALNMAAKGDAFDWLEGQLDGIDAGFHLLPIRASWPVVEDEPTGADLLPAPLPLSRRVSDEIALPLRALGNVLGPAAKAIADSVQCDPAMAVNSVLAAASLAAQGIAHVGLDGRTSPLSLFFLTLAGSGERKSAVNSAAMSAVRAVEKEKMLNYRAELLAYEELLKNPVEGVIPEKPVDPSILNEDFTLDALVMGLATGCPSQGVFTAEGGAFLGGYAMAKEHLLRTSTTLSALHSGESISRKRVTGSFSVQGRLLAVHLMVQPEIARQFIGHPIVQDQGLLPRFLMTEAVPYIGSRGYASVQTFQSMMYREYVNKLASLMRKDLTTDGLGGLVTRELTLEEDAKNLWINEYNSIEVSCQDGREFEHYKSYASKLPDQILRIAGVITIFENASATSISAQVMEGAIQLGRYYIAQAKRLLLTPEDQKLTETEQLLAWLQRQGSSEIALRDIYRLGPKFVRSAAKARSLMQVLEEHFWVTRLQEEIRSQDGKLCKEAYFLRA